MPISEARELFSLRLPEYENYVNDFLNIHEVILEPHQFDVLVSLTFNIGPGLWTRTEGSDLYWNIAKMVRNGPPFVRPPITREIEQEDIDVEIDEVFVWTFGGRVQNLSRRLREREIFFNGH